MRHYGAYGMHGVVLLVVVFAQMGAASRSAAAEAEDPGDLERVRKAWTERQKAVPSYRVAWKTERIAKRGSMIPGPDQILRQTPQPIDPRSLGAGVRGLGPVPPEDTTLEYTRSLLLDDGRYRFTYSGKYWRADLRAYTEVEGIDTCDGLVGYTCNQSADGIIQSGHIKDARDMLRRVEMQPVVLALSPMHASLSWIVLDEYVIDERGAEFDGHRCLVLKQTTGDERRGQWEIWVDPECGFVIRSVRRRYGDIIRDQRDISYTESNGRFLPVSWKETRLSPAGELRDTSTSTVVSQELLPKSQITDFRIDFPMGTLVFDQRPTHREQFIVLSDGQKRPVLDEEIDAGLTEEMLKASKPGELLKSPTVP